MKNTEFTVMLSELRERYGLSMRDLGKKIGYSASYLSDLENGNRDPSKPLLTAIISAFDLDDLEKRKLYDAAAKSNNSIPYDVEEFLIKNPNALTAVIRVMEGYNNTHDKNKGTL
jgi:transcriptional regulator with XRE-family HTH domain